MPASTGIDRLTGAAILQTVGESQWESRLPPFSHDPTPMRRGGTVSCHPCLFKRAILQQTTLHVGADTQSTRINLENDDGS